MRAWCGYSFCGSGSGSVYDAWGPTQSSQTPRKWTSTSATVKPRRSRAGSCRSWTSTRTSRTFPHTVQMRWWWASSTLGSTRTLPVPRWISSTSPIASRSWTVWYTVLSEMVGMSSRARSYRASTVGWLASPWSRRKIAWRWGVTRRPCSRNRSVRSSTVLMRTPRYRQQLSTANRGPERVGGWCGRRTRPFGAGRRGWAYASPAMGLLVGNVIRHAAAVVPDRLAATMGDDDLTFAQLEERTNQVARAFAGLGVGAGDRVAWWGETGLAAMPIFGALAKLGAAFMPVNARLGVDEAEAVIGYAKPRLTVVDEAHEGASFDALRQAELLA